MKPFRKSRCNLLVVLIYLVTLQVCAASAFYSIYVSAANGIVYIKEPPPKSYPRYQVVLRKHLPVNTNVIYSNLEASSVFSFSLPGIKDFVISKVADRITPQKLIIYEKLKDRAPPVFS